jgi:hypothetical protein
MCVSGDNEAGLRPFALFDVSHLRAVDMFDLEPKNLAGTQSRAGVGPEAVGIKCAWFNEEGTAKFCAHTHGPNPDLSWRMYYDFVNSTSWF